MKTFFVKFCLRSNFDNHDVEMNMKIEAKNKESALNKLYNDYPHAYNISISENNDFLF